MMKKLSLIYVILLFLASLFPLNVFAAAPAEYTIDVRNRTGAPVEFNYRGADGILHWVTVPVGVSSLTLTEGAYNYWADPKCGHIAGSLNLNQERQVLWITCDADLPSVTLRVRSGGCADYGVYVPDENDFFSQTHWNDLELTFDNVLYLLFELGIPWNIDPYQTCFSSIVGIVDYYTEVPYDG